MVHEAVFAHKSLTGKTTKTIYNRYNHYKSKFNTRNSCKNKLNIPQHNSTKYKKSPLYRTIKSWNKSLPVLDLGNIKNHKETFQKSFLDNSSINPQIKCNQVIIQIFKWAERFEIKGRIPLWWVSFHCEPLRITMRITIRILQFKQIFQF